MNRRTGWIVHPLQMLGDLLDVACAVGFAVDIADAARWFWRQIQPGQ